MLRNWKNLRPNCIVRNPGRVLPLCSPYSSVGPGRAMAWVLSFSLAAGPPILYESIIVRTNKGQLGIEMWNEKAERERESTWREWLQKRAKRSKPNPISALSLMQRLVWNQNFFGPNAFSFPSPVSLPLSRTLSLLNLCLKISLSVCLQICLPLPFAVCQFVTSSPSMTPSVYQSIRLSVNQSVR